MAKKHQHSQFLVCFFAIFKPITTTKTLSSYFHLVEEFLSFNLVGHMWKLVKNWLQEWIFSHNISHSILSKIFPQEFLARFSRKNFLQDFPARISRKIFPQEFAKLDPDCWLPITLFQMLNFHQSLLCEIRLLIIKVPRCPHHPFPKSHGNPKSMNKLTLNEPAKSAFSLLPLGRYLLPVTTRNRYNLPVVVENSFCHYIKEYNYCQM